MSFHRSISYSYHISLLVEPLFYSFPSSPHPCHFRSNTSPSRKTQGRSSDRWENNNKIRLQNRLERDGLGSFGSDFKLMARARGHFLVQLNMGNWLIECLIASQEGSCTMQSISWVAWLLVGLLFG
jgi:hypothetical protein